MILRRDSLGGGAHANRSGTGIVIVQVFTACIIDPKEWRLLLPLLCVVMMMMLKKGTRVVSMIVIPIGWKRMSRLCLVEQFLGSVHRGGEVIHWRTGIKSTHGE